MLITKERERSMVNLIDVGKEYPLFLCSVCVMGVGKGGESWVNYQPTVFLPNLPGYPGNLIKESSEI